MFNLRCLRPSIFAQLTTQSTFTRFGLSLWRYNGNNLLSEFAPYFDLTALAPSILTFFLNPFLLEWNGFCSDSYYVHLFKQQPRQLIKVIFLYKLQNAPRFTDFCVDSIINSMQGKAVYGFARLKFGLTDHTRTPNNFVPNLLSLSIKVLDYNDNKANDLLCAYKCQIGGCTPHNS